MGDRERISAASGHDRSGRSCASALRLSEPRQRWIPLRHAMVYPHQRSDRPAKSLRRFKILADEISRRLQKTYRFQHARLVPRQPLEKLSANYQASDGGRVLRRDGAHAGAVQKNIAADFDHYRPIRWRRAGRDDVLSRSHRERLTRNSGKHFLIIGPWDHAGTRTPTDEVGGVKFGPAAIVDLNDLHRQWYDWTMKNGAKPEFLKNQVAYYLLAPGNSGANGEWKYADNFETLVANPKIFYLDSKDGDANGVFRSGSLAEKQPTDGSDTFIYDPLDTTRGETVDGLNPKEKTAGLDQTYPLSIGKDGLVYHTEALSHETPFIGCPAVTLWLSIDTPDVDLSASLYEIQPDGTSIVLWNDIRRLRYRESLREAKLVEPGEIVRCDFNPGLFVARRLMKGSRLRLVVSALNSTAFEKNYCSGRVVAEETAKDAHTCHVQVYHDATHPSTIQLPVR